jgi:hypothetical protein
VSLFHSLRFLAARDHCHAATLLNVSAHRVFGSPLFLLPILTSHTNVACAHLRCSILATWHPNFHLRLWSHFHDVLHVGCLPYFSFIRSVFPYKTQFLGGRCDPTRVMAFSFLRFFLDHTTTVGRTPLEG